MYKYLNPNHMISILRGSVHDRLRNWKAQDKKYITGPYHSNLDATFPSMFFYLGSDFMPGLRWAWCDVINPHIGHTGWFCDEFQDEKIRGLVMRLPNNRGFLAGWSMGDGMASEVEREIHHSEYDAAYAANELAKEAAYRERQHQQAHQLEQDIDACRDTIRRARAGFRSLVAEYRTTHHLPATIEALVHNRLKAYRLEVRNAVVSIKQHREDITFLGEQL